MRKARWRQHKKETDPGYCEKVKAYDRERKRKITSRLTSLPETPTKQKPPPSYYRVLSTSKKVQNILGPSPNMHTCVLKHVIKKAMKSPRKSSHMPEYSSGLAANFITPPKDTSVAKNLRKIAILQSKKRFQEAQSAAMALKLKFKSVSQIALKSGELQQAVYRLLSKSDKSRAKDEYVRKLKQEDRDEVLKVYNDEEVSYLLPDIKYSGLRFMYFTLHEAYEVYLRKCSRKRKVAEKTFESLKPKCVKTVQDMPLRGARCEYCANFAKTREALIALGIKGIPRNHAKAIELTLCNFRTSEASEKRDGIRHTKLNLRHAEMPQKQCALRNCEKCGVTPYQRSIIVSNKARMALLKKVTWKQWGKVKYKNKKGKQKTKTDIVEHTGSVVNLMNVYFKQLRSMSSHQFFKILQLRNFNLTLYNIRRGQVLMVHDFQ